MYAQDLIAQLTLGGRSSSSFVWASKCAHIIHTDHNNSTWIFYFTRKILKLQQVIKRALQILFALKLTMHPNKVFSCVIECISGANSSWLLR